MNDERLTSEDEIESPRRERRRLATRSRTDCAARLFARVLNDPWAAVELRPERTRHIERRSQA
ncbi:MAG: hypothetical protein QF890_16440 [Myxococcota bacterium]|nr:hypothetical protein [Deltaproteobacteria bacterium]MCP4242232.1 hypothetical protein [bacterium]MDP6244008.1 hypothetical protein [Myxococcota bacterium]MDP7074396.1 hypothetical protein [Myxococcota bacterium]MDP7300550.1 hypothetical protein [Myxococcota bacterium]